MPPNTATAILDLPDRHVDVDSIVKSLDGKRSGDRWLCHCPVHEDENPSLSLNVSTEGKFLVHCFADYPQESAVSAMRRLLKQVQP